MKINLIIMLSVLALLGCNTAASHRASVDKGDSEKISVGTVQREIKIGMSGVAVIEALGAPNMVSTDKDRNEVWIYDKVSNTTVKSASSGGANVLILFGNSESGATSTSQKTLTIIIKFNKDKAVRDFSYRTSSF